MTYEKQSACSAANPAWHSSQIWPVCSFKHSTNQLTHTIWEGSFYLLQDGGIALTCAIAVPCFYYSRTDCFSLRNRHDLYTLLQCDLVKKLPSMFITGCGRNEQSSSALTANALPKNVSLSEKKCETCNNNKKMNPKTNSFRFVDPQMLYISGSGICELVCMSVPFLVSFTVALLFHIAAKSCKSTCPRECCHYNKVTATVPRDGWNLT